MKGTRRKGFLAAALAVAGTAVAVPVIVSGTASAQAGSRLCGTYWVFEDPELKEFEIVTNIYEVNKDANDTCEEAKTKASGPGNYPFAHTLRHQDFSAWRGATFESVECEDWRKRPFEQGGQGGKDISFHDVTAWPANDSHDICNNMERSNRRSAMVDYWLVWEKWGNGANSQVTFMQRPNRSV